MLADGKSFFLSKRARLWNAFDLLVVASSLAETLAGFLVMSGSIDIAQSRAMRAIRVTRLLRAFRLVRVAKSVRSLQTLLHSITVTMKSLVWVVLLILMLFYGFGIAFTQAARDHIDAGQAYLDPSGKPKELMSFWGTLPRSMFTLFKAIAGGISWHEVVEPLSDIGWFWVMLFCFFIVVSVFAILNVVTGVFCQSAIESAQRDQDMMMQSIIANRHYHATKMKGLFQDIDSDQSGFITLQELESRMEDEAVKAYFTSLELDVHDAWTFFKLLDTDEGHTIEIEEFIIGCMQLRGPAKALDMARLMHENQLISKHLTEFMLYVEQQFLVLAGDESLEIMDAFPKPSMRLSGSWASEVPKSAGGDVSERRPSKGHAANLPPSSFSKSLGWEPMA
mmetsp:Transcript_3781/g.8679  ORF Transcript_3781/g.8679 Transcript_3781/m.8679 type:complete len:393 (+) Transcript_3781:1-1179(+)